MPFLDFLVLAIPSILSAVILGLLAWFAKHMKTFMHEHKLLIESERNDLKAKIVNIYETAKARNAITHMELETLNRLNDSYVAFHGNTYIDAVVYDANHNIPIVGSTIPSLVESVMVKKYQDSDNPMFAVGDDSYGVNIPTNPKGSR